MIGKFIKSLIIFVIAFILILLINRGNPILFGDVIPKLLPTETQSFGYRIVSVCCIAGAIKAIMRVLS